MATMTTAKKELLNRMNQIAKKVGLGTLLDSYASTHIVVAAGNHTTAGGDANESISASGVLSTDVAIVTLKTAGATPRTITTAAAGTDAVAVVMSGDPSTDHVLNYVVYREVA